MVSSILNMENYKAYLDYAKGIEEVSPVMALYCKIYYAEKLLESKKQTKSTIMQQNESIYINDMLKQIHKTHEALGLKREQKQQLVEQYCGKSYEKTIGETLQPGFDKEGCAGRLRTVANFIDVLTVFSPLTPEWIQKSIYVLCTENRGRMH